MTRLCDAVIKAGPRASPRFLVRKSGRDAAFQMGGAMILVRPILASLMVLALAACASGPSREEREARVNVFPDHYKTDLAAAVRTYVADPTKIRDAYVSDPGIRTIGPQNRYAACVRFNAKNSDGRYMGSRDLMAIFVAGRFDQFIDPPSQPNPSSLAVEVAEQCKQVEYRRFPELEALVR